MAEGIAVEVDCPQDEEACCSGRAGEEKRTLSAFGKPGSKAVTECHNGEPRDERVAGHHRKAPHLENTRTVQEIPERAGIHAVGSIPALLSLRATESALAAVVAAEFVIHYHIDWSKERINSMFGLRNNSAPYWMVFGGDQLLHQLTYLAIVGVLLPH